MTTISSVQEHICQQCKKRFDSRVALNNHMKLHRLDSGHQKNNFPDARTIAIAGAIATGIVVTGIIAWRLARKRKNAS